MAVQEKHGSGVHSGRVNIGLQLFNFRVDTAAFAYAMTTLGSCMINNIFSFYYVKLFISKYKISEGTFHQSQVSLFAVNVNMLIKKKYAQNIIYIQATLCDLFNDITKVTGHKLGQLPSF